jgi:hypothetical protein
LRKTQTVVVGLLATAALGGTAVAQTATPSHTVDASFSPAKAGTATKPRAVGVKLNISNDRAAGTTASKIEINLSNGLRMNPKGFQICSASAIEDEGIAACPPKSRLGTGTAGAVVAPNAASDDDPATSPSPLTFKTTFFVGGSNFLNIRLEQVGGAVRATLKGTISNGGRRLTIPIPGDLQQPAPRVFSALTDIKTSLKGTTAGARKHGFFELGKCAGGKITVTTKLTYVNNPEPPARPNSTATDTQRCS